MISNSLKIGQRQNLLYCSVWLLRKNKNKNKKKPWPMRKTSQTFLALFFISTDFSFFQTANPGSTKPNRSKSSKKYNNVKRQKLKTEEEYHQAMAFLTFEAKTTKNRCYMFNRRMTSKKMKKKRDSTVQTSMTLLFEREGERFERRKWEKGIWARLELLRVSERDDL